MSRSIDTFPSLLAPSFSPPRRFTQPSPPLPPTHSVTIALIYLDIFSSLASLSLRPSLLFLLLQFHIHSHRSRVRPAGRSQQSFFRHSLRHLDDLLCRHQLWQHFREGVADHEPQPHNECSSMPMTVDRNLDLPPNLLPLYHIWRPASKRGCAKPSVALRILHPHEP